MIIIMKIESLLSIFLESIGAVLLFEGFEGWSLMILMMPTDTTASQTAKHLIFVGFSHADLQVIYSYIHMYIYTSECIGNACKYITYIFTIGTARPKISPQFRYFDNVQGDSDRR